MTRRTPIMGNGRDDYREMRAGFAGPLPMADALRAMEWLEPAPSEANFILVRMDRGEASDVREALRRRGVFVRTFDHPRLRQHLRNLGSFGGAG